MNIVQKSMNRKPILGSILIISLASITMMGLPMQQSYPRTIGTGVNDETSTKAPIATSGDKNVYVVWWTNKTGNDEVMFKASTDGGKTFSDKMNLSNSTNAQSQDVQVAASGNNVYVSWWERNATSNEPVMRISNDNDRTFGEKIMLSSK